MPTPDEAISNAEAERELERVLASPAFAGAASHQRLLRHLVRHRAEAPRLKEMALGIEVFLRPAASFDPKADSIVRVEARRLRERLRRHYAQDGAGPWQLVLPKGSYRVQWQPRAAGAGEAAELVERGLFFLRQGHDEGHRKALQRFEQAAHAAPGLAAAHSGVARAWLQLVATNLEPPRPGIDTALAAVRRALELQPAHADSLVLAAQLTHRFEFDWPAARALFERAERAAPGVAYVHHSLALSLMMRAEHEAAEAALARARQLDPLHLGLRAHLGLLHLYRRQWDDAEAVLRALLDMSERNVLGMSLLAYVALCRGDAATALQRYDEVAAAHPQLSIGPAGKAQALAAAGDADGARRVLHELRANWSGRYLSPYQLAMVAVRLADIEIALTELERAVHERDPNALCLPVDPAFDALHREPRFRRLEATVLSGSSAAPAPP